MKIIRQTSPYIHKKVSVEKMMIHFLISLLPLVIFSIYANGFNSLYVFLVTCITNILCEFIFVLITKKKYTINNLLTPLITGIIFALLMPCKSDVYVLIISSMFGIIFGKLVFGGLGNNIFNPACLSRVFAMITFGSKIDYTFDKFIDVTTNATPLVTTYDLKDMFLGFIPGSMGEVNKLLIIISLIYLVITFTIDYRITLSLVITFFILSSVWAIKLDKDILNFSLYSLLSGGILFGATFMATDPVTSPISSYGRILYGMIIAIIAIMIRAFGAFPEGVAFAILIANMLTSPIDNLTINVKKRNKIITISVLLLLSMIIVYFGVSI